WSDQLCRRNCVDPTPLQCLHNTYNNLEFYCLRALPTRTRPAPVFISRSSLPLSTITRFDAETAAGGGNVSVNEPVQSALTVYVPVEVRDGMITPFKLTVVVCETVPLPSKEMIPTSPTGP